MHTLRMALAGAIVAGAAIAGVPAAAAGTTSAVAPSNATVITLVTGDRIAVTTDNGKTNYNLLGSDKAGFHEFQAPGGDEYLIPAIAQPYLGRGLDESLFDVTALAKQGDTGKIPVDLSFTGAPAAPAGVTLTSVTGQTAAGYLTPDSASAFGATLRRRIGADVAAGRPVGTTAAFPGLAGISLSGTTEPSSAEPNYPLHRVQINVTDLDGKPDNTALVFLANTDAFSHLLAGMPIANGIGKVEAPAGHYMLVAYFNEFDANGNPTAIWQVIQDGLTVPSGAGTTTFTVAQSQANLQVTVSTPRPATYVAMDYLYWRTDATGNQQEFGTLAHGVPVYVNASTPPTGTGSGYMQMSWVGVGTDNSYLYSVAFADQTGIPADENFIVRPDQLATQADNLYAPVGTTGNGSMLSDAGDPVHGHTYGFYAPVPWGQTLTHYVGTADGGSWITGGDSPNGIAFFGQPQTFTAGRHYVTDWGKEPIAPSPISSTAPAYCYLCAAGTTLGIDDIERGDSDPTHAGALHSTPKSLHFALYQGDKKIADSTTQHGATVTGIPSAHTGYREVLDENLAGMNGFSLSTTTHTERTFNYDPDDPSLALQYACAGWTPTTPCQVLPVLSAHYDLAGLDLTSTSTSPVQRLDLGIDHLTIGGTGSHSPITAVTVSVSFDGGAHWLPVPVFGRDGHYAAFWPNTATGVSPAIQVTAADAAGDTLSQTVTNAYLIGATK